MPAVLSSGYYSTLRNYRVLCVTRFGEDSPAVKLLDQRISVAPNGGFEEVLDDEIYFTSFLFDVHNGVYEV